MGGRKAVLGPPVAAGPTEAWGSTACWVARGEHGEVPKACGRGGGVGWGGGHGQAREGVVTLQGWATESEGV